MSSSNFWIGFLSPVELRALSENMSAQFGGSVLSGDKQQSSQAPGDHGVYRAAEPVHFNLHMEAAPTGTPAAAPDAPEQSSEKSGKKGSCCEPDPSEDIESLYETDWSSLGKTLDVAEAKRRDSVDVIRVEHDTDQEPTHDGRERQSPDVAHELSCSSGVVGDECPETERPVPQSPSVDTYSPRRSEFDLPSRHEGAAESVPQSPSVDISLPRFSEFELPSRHGGAADPVPRSPSVDTCSSRSSELDLPSRHEGAADSVPLAKKKPKRSKREKKGQQCLYLDHTTTQQTTFSSSSPSSSYTPSVTPLYSTVRDVGVHFGVKNVVSVKRRVQFGRKEIIVVEESIHLWMTRTPNQLSFRPSSLPFRPMLKKVWDKFPWDQAELSCGTDSDGPMTRYLDNQTLRKTYFCRVDGVVYVPGRPQYHQERLPAVFDLRLFCPPQNTDPHSWSHVVDNDQFHCACGYFPGNENFVFWDHEWESD